MDQKELITLLESIDRIKLIRQLDKNELPTNKERVHFAFDIEVLGKDQPNRLVIGFESTYPYSLPYYFIQKGIFLPHVEETGYVCYTLDNAIVNHSLPKNIIEDTLEDVLNTIRKGYSKENEIDFLTEFEDYWVRNINLSEVIRFEWGISVPPIFKMLNYVTISRPKSKTKLQIIGNDQKEISHIAHRFFERSNLSSTPRRILFIPLNGENKVLPPNYNSFWTMDEIKQIVFDNISEDDATTIKALLADIRKIQREEYIVLSIPRQNGVVLIGLAFLGIKEQIHPLISERTSFTIKPVFVERFEKEIIQPRGGVNSNLDNKRILLIGCGSVGSKLCFELTRLGISNITVVDNDTLSLENLYRHQLGKRYLGKNKAIALAKELNNELPYINVTAIPTTLENAVNNEKFKLLEFDMILSATGNVNTGFFLNNYAHKLKSTIPILYIWNEPFGIGGHCALIANTTQSCYECLYDENLNNRASFCEAGQHFERKISGCSSSYVPFSSMDSMKTVLLCLETVKKHFQGELTENSILSWKGPYYDFSEAGYKTSNRYEMTEQQLFETKHKFKKQNCSICN